MPNAKSMQSRRAQLSGIKIPPSPLDPLIKRLDAAAAKKDPKQKKRKRAPWTKMKGMLKIGGGGKK